MSLTPADVHNVAFSKPPIGKRGYNEDEVDAFLDLVEAELARLIEDNNDLRNQVEQLDQQLRAAPGGQTYPDWRRWTGPVHYGSVARGVHTHASGGSEIAATAVGDAQGGYP